MRNYEYSKKWQQLLTPEIVTMLSQIHEFKGEQNLFIEAKSDILTGLVEIAKIQSTEASNKSYGDSLFSDISAYATDIDSVDP